MIKEETFEEEKGIVEHMSHETGEEGGPWREEGLKKDTCGRMGKREEKTDPNEGYITSQRETYYFISFHKTIIYKQVFE